MTGEPNLGQFSTRELLEELDRRSKTMPHREENWGWWIRLLLDRLPPALLDYRTVEPDLYINREEDGPTPEVVDALNRMAEETAHYRTVEGT